MFIQSKQNKEFLYTDAISLGLNIGVKQLASNRKTRFTFVTGFFVKKNLGVLEKLSDNVASLIDVMINNYQILDE